MNGTPSSDGRIVGVLRRLAVEAGREALRLRERGELNPRAKPGHGLVTSGDLAAERTIVAGLKVAFPEIPVISEESAIPEISPTATFFLVDPIDSTSTYLAGGDEFTVNVALIHDRIPVAGIVFAPALRRSYRTNHDLSAVREDWDAALTAARSRPVRPFVEQAALRSALVSGSQLDGKTRSWLSREGVVKSKPVSSSLKFGLLADGAAEVYPRMTSVNEWDIAAGHAVLLAAGGSMVNAITGEPITYGTPKLPTRPFLAFAPGVEPRKVLSQWPPARPR